MGESAASKKAFYCELCSKGYNRVNEYDAHLSSYDHSHKKRLADMKAMQRPSASARREKERKAEAAAGMITIKPIALSNTATANTSNASSLTTTGATKRSGFRSAFSTLGGTPEISSGGSGFKKVFVSLEGKGIGGGTKSMEIKGSKNEDLKGVGKLGRPEEVDDGGIGESDTDEECGKLYDPAFPTGP